MNEWFVHKLCVVYLFHVFLNMALAVSNVLFDSCCESARRVTDSFESISKRGRSTCEMGGDTSRLFFRRNTLLFKKSKVHKSSYSTFTKR